MNEEEIFNRIHHFFLKQLPQAKLAKTFTKDAIFHIIKEGSELSHLGEMDLMLYMRDLDPQIIVENALQEAVASLLDNLRFSKEHSEHLKQAVKLHAPEKDAQSYLELIERRNVTRDDYLYACTLLQESDYKDCVKAYLMLNQLVLVHRINPSKLEAHIKYLSLRSGGKERMKLLRILSLESSRQHFQVALQIVDSVNLDFDLLSKLNSWSLLKSLNEWQVFRLKVFNLLNRQCSEADSLQEIEQVGAFILSVLHAKPDKKTNYEVENENIFEDLFAELLRSLDSNINISNFYKSELFNYLHVGLVKRTHG